MYQRVLACLLHYSNADPPHWRKAFYDIKNRLLRRYGTFRGHELQEIRKECWGPREWDHGWCEWKYLGCAGKTCIACDGTGLFDIRWVRLERWEWCGYVFHRPDGDTRIQPNPENEGYKRRIIGRIEHPEYGRKPREAVLWLLLLTGEWRRLWYALSTSRSCGRHLWPLLNVQAVTMEVSMFLSWRRCYCGRRYPTWGTGWQICKRCRNRPVETPF